MTLAASEIHADRDETHGERGRRSWQSIAWMRPGSPGPMYAGLAVTAIGFLVLAFAWSRVAGIGTVALQLPYVLSGGFTGLGLILVGLTIVNVAALRTADAERRRQMERLLDRLDQRSDGER